MTHTTAPIELAPAQIEAVRRQTIGLVAVFASSLVVYAVLFPMLARSSLADIRGLDTIRIVVFAVVGVVIFTSTVVRGVLLRNAPRDPVLRLARLRTATIVAAGMAELPAMLGLVLGILGAGATDFYLLAIVSLYMLVRHFPRREPWHDYVRRGGSDVAR